METEYRLFDYSCTICPATYISGAWMQLLQHMSTLKSSGKSMA